MNTPWCMASPRGAARARGSREDGFGQTRRHDPVRRVDDLADLEVDRDAAEDIGLLAAEPTLLDQVVDHVTDRLLCVGEQIGAVRRRHVAGSALQPGEDRPACPESRLAEAAPGPEAEWQGDR